MARGIRTRECIETEALRLFVERGVAETSIRDIAHAVGVTDGAAWRALGGTDATPPNTQTW